MLDPHAGRVPANLEKGIRELFGNIVLDNIGIKGSTTILLQICSDIGNPLFGNLSRGSGQK
jgi:hypothetical protein